MIDLATFQIYYSTIAMLSCRAGRTGSLPYVRRSLAADEVQHIASKMNPNRLLPLPLIPYSISLALTVAYRDLRDGHKSASMAIDDIFLRCDSLEALGSNWPTAKIMARLGRAVLTRSKSASSILIEDTYPMAHSNSVHRHGHNRSTSIADDSSIAYANHGELQARGPRLGTPEQSTADRCETMGAFTSDQGSPSAPQSPPNGSVIYSDLDDMFGSMLDTSWINMSQDLIGFSDSAKGIT